MEGIVEHGVCALGHQHVDVGGVSFTLQKIVPFEEWVTTHDRPFNAFMDLKPADREKVFLRWKWGFKEEAINSNLEYSERVAVRMHTGVDINRMPEGMRYHIEHKLAFERLCLEIRKRIGLARLEKEDITPEMQVAMDVFAARLPEVDQ